MTWPTEETLFEAIYQTTPIDEQGARRAAHIVLALFPTETEVRVETLRQEVRWFTNAHKNSERFAHRYESQLREGFGLAVGWLELHLAMAEKGQEIEVSDDDLAN